MCELRHQGEGYAKTASILSLIFCLFDSDKNTRGIETIPRKKRLLWLNIFASLSSHQIIVSR